MPITKSAKKALRQAQRRKVYNLARKNAAKDIIKKIKKLAESGKIDEASSLLPQAYKVLDKAAKTNAVHKNAAGRRKSSLAKLVAGSKKTQ